MATLSDLVEVVKKQCQPADATSPVYVGLEHLDPGIFRLRRHGSPSDVRSSKTCFRTGDVLYGKLRPYLDKAVIADADGICSTDILVFRPKPGVLATFLLGVVHSSRFRAHAIATTHGVNHPRTKWSSLREFEVGLPSEREQRRVSAAMLAVQNAIETEENLIRATRELKLSTLCEIFAAGRRWVPGSRASDAEAGWEMVPMGPYLTRAQYGLSIKGEKRGQYPILRMNCQVDGRVVFRDLQFVDLDAKTFEAFRLEDGDLLFNRTNSIDLVGRNAVVHSDREAVFASYLIRLTLDSDEFDPDFVNQYLNYPSTQIELKKLASRGVSQANISASKLKRFEIPKPPLDVQKEIAGALSAFDSYVQSSEARRDALVELSASMLDTLVDGGIDLGSLRIPVSQVVAA